MIKTIMVRSSLASQLDTIQLSIIQTQENSGCIAMDLSVWYLLFHHLNSPFIQESPSNNQTEYINSRKTNIDPSAVPYRLVVIYNNMDFHMAALR